MNEFIAYCSDINSFVWVLIGLGIGIPIAGAICISYLLGVITAISSVLIGLFNLGKNNDD